MISSISNGLHAKPAGRVVCACARYTAPTTAPTPNTTTKPAAGQLLDRRGLFMAVVAAPLVPQLVAPDAAPAAELRDMTSAEREAFEGVMENLFNDGFDSPRPDRFTPILLRIAFHDAGTWIAADKEGGANASIAFELNGPPNNSVVRRFGWPIVERIKESLAETAASTFSLADVIALAPAYGITKMQGGDYLSMMKVGRPDATGEDKDWPEQLPEPSFSLDEMKANFARKGFNTREMVVLSGSHTIGRIPGVGGAVFDNSYYKNILKSSVGLASDQMLVREDETRPMVEEYANDNSKFIADFRTAYVKLMNFVA